MFFDGSESFYARARQVGVVGSTLGLVTAAALAGCVMPPPDGPRAEGDRGATAGGDPARAGGDYVTAAEIEQEFGHGEDYLVRTSSGCSLSPQPGNRYELGQMRTAPRGEDEEAEFLIYNSGNTVWASEYYRIAKVEPRDVTPGTELIFYRENGDNDRLPETVWEPPKELHEFRSGRFCGPAVVTDTGWLDQGAVRTGYRDHFVDQHGMFIKVPAH